MGLRRGGCNFSSLTDKRAGDVAKEAIMAVPWDLISLRPLSMIDDQIIDMALARN
jgi:hypothetical protein